MKTIREHPLLPLQPPLSHPSAAKRYLALPSAASPDGGATRVSLVPADGAPTDAPRWPRDEGDPPLFSARSAGGRAAFVASVPGGVRLSLRDSGADRTTDRAADVEIDLSRLTPLSSVAAARCSVDVDGGGGAVTIRLVDVRGSLLSLSLDLRLAPAPGGECGRLLPFPASAAPRGDSALEACQVCFLRSSVVMALDPHLYRLSFDSLGDPEDAMDAEAEGGNVRVWSIRHRTLNDVRKRSRQSLGDILKEASYTLGLKEKDFLTGRRLPSVSALARFVDVTPAHDDDDEEEERVAALHSDGSLRIWTDSRIPTVQRVVLPSADGCADPMLHPSDWDSYDSIKMAGSTKYEDYELAIAVKHADGKYRVFVFQGTLIGGDYDGGDCANEMVLPEGCSGVKDLVWKEGSLVVALEKGEEEVLAIYPPGRTEAIAPERGGVGRGRGPSAEEEMERFFVGSTEGGTDAEDGRAGGAEDRAAEAEAKVDRAGLLSLVRPSGRPRPSALAVHRALTSLNLVDSETKAESIGPVDIVSAMRKWKTRDALRPSEETSLAARREGKDGSAPMSPETGDSIYHAFASAKKEAAPAIVDEGRASARSPVARNVESAENTHLMRWITFLAEVRRQDSKLNQVVCLASMSSSCDLLVRSNMISAITFGDSSADKLPIGQEGDLMARLDELSLKIMEFAMSTPELRRMLCHVESLLFDAASKASCLISRWRDGGSNNELMYQLDVLGQSALSSFNMNDRQRELPRILSGLDVEFVEEWLYPPTSKSSSVRASLALSDSPNWTGSPFDLFGGADAQSSAVFVVTARLESIRQLSLARLLLVISSSRSASSSSSHGGLRAVLFCTALSWSLNQPSHRNSTRTFLEEHLFQVGKSVSCGSELLAGEFIRDIFQFYAGSSETSSLSNLISSTSEPSSTLRLLAPLVEFPPQTSSTIQNTTQIAAECLLVESAISQPSGLWELASNLLLDTAQMDYIDDSNSHIVFQGLASYADQNRSFVHDPHLDEKLFKVANAIFLSDDIEGDVISQVNIQRMCSMPTIRELLLPLASSAPVSRDQGSIVKWVLSAISRDAPISKRELHQFFKTILKISKLISRADTLQRHLQLVKNDQVTLSKCCGIGLSAIHDTITAITTSLPPSVSKEMNELSILWSQAFETSIKGHLWDQALRSCVSIPSQESQSSNFRKLVLDMVGADAIDSLVDMSMAVVGQVQESEDEMVDIHSGIFFDVFDSATKIIEEAALQQASAASKTAHDIEAVWKDRPNYWGALYTLHASRGNWKAAAEAMDMRGKVAASTAMSNQPSTNRATSQIIIDEVSSSATACAHAISLIDKASDRYILPNKNGKGLLTEIDIENRAVRAVALLAFSLDEYSPDSVASILKATSRDSIDMLARLGYYDQAITVAKGLSLKRNSRPGGIDLFDDALKHIISMYLVPAALSRNTMFQDEADEEIQSRSKIAQIRLSSSACSMGNPISSSSTNSKFFMSNKCCDKALQSDMAMDLLRQYTIAYATSCSGLSLHAASSILSASDGISDLPHWLEELCMFGIDSKHDKQSGAFASGKGGCGAANPAGLVRLLMKYHKYKDACEVVTRTLSNHNEHISKSLASSTSRLPEKGSIDYLPYDLIDSLWSVIQYILASGQNSSVASELRSTQIRMESALVKYFELSKLSEEGLKSARALAH